LTGVTGRATRRARELLREARAAYDALGMRRHAEIAEQLLA
jgi:hypothetical protein